MEPCPQLVESMFDTSLPAIGEPHPDNGRIVTNIRFDPILKTAVRPWWKFWQKSEPDQGDWYYRVTCYYETTADRVERVKEGIVRRWRYRIA